MTTSSCQLFVSDLYWRGSRRSRGTRWGGAVMRMVVTRFVAACVALGAVLPLSLPASADSANGTYAALRHHVAHGGDIVEAIRAGRLHKSTASAPNSGSVCPAEPSTTGNVQVNCRAEDAAYPPSA